MDSNQNTVLQFKKLSENATMPVRNSPFSTGLDLFSAESKIIPGQSCASEVDTLKETERGSKGFGSSGY